MPSFPFRHSRSSGAGIDRPGGPTPDRTDGLTLRQGVGTATGSSPTAPQGGGRPRPLLLVGLLLAMGATVHGCESAEEWSPLDGPWDPNHPEAARILAPPQAGDVIDEGMAEAGERWYRVRGCLACHRVDGVDVAGPALDGVTIRREYDWFRAMVRRPDSMVVHDPIARALMDQYRVPMPVQGVNDLQVRAIWEYLRSIDEGGGGEEAGEAEAS